MQNKRFDTRLAQRIARRIFSPLEPDSFINEADGGEIRKYECVRDTFAMLGKHSGAVVENAAIAASIARDTESPIETFFGADAFKFLSERYRNHPTMKFERCHQSAEHNFTGDHTLLMHQYIWCNYRIDWVIKVTFLKRPYFFIECDGQEYHSSENQILYDKQKNEKIRNAGIQIFRFSGSDLNRNASACVKVVFLAMQMRYEQERSAGFHD